MDHDRPTTHPPEQEIPVGLGPLLEAVAERVHDTWMEGRHAEGWTYGPRRDDDARTHPGLVPYSELPESEKEYDRRTALAAILAIVAHGYRIEGPG
jgi:hypothetical protein